MKAIASNAVKSLSIGSHINCADNTGVKEFQIISVRGYKGKRRTKPRAGIADLVKCRVSKGNEKVRHEMFSVVIIRVKKEYKRANGLRVSFEDNAGVVIDEKNLPKGTMIKGPVAREAIDRFSAIGKLVSLAV